MPIAQKTFNATGLYAVAFSLVLLQFALPLASGLSRLGVVSAFGPQPSSEGGNAASMPAPDSNAGGGASFNWAGYAAAGSFSGVSGSWVVPSIEAGDTTASDATWIGIGGVTGRDLIQAGTQAAVENGTVEYRAWYELLPDSMTYVPLSVHPGDRVAASITDSAPGRWQITLLNGTTGKSYSTEVSYDSSGSSVEWIEERPSLESGGLLPLDNFGSINWQGAYATTASGERISAADAGAEAISMLSRSGAMLATPTPLGSGGDTFAVQRVSASAAATPADTVVSPLPVRITVPVPFVPLSNDSSQESVSAHESSSDSHGAYYLYVNGKLVEKRQW